MFRYPIEVFWSDEDEGFVAIARDLPGCSAWGENEAKAIEELHDAADAWLEAARITGRIIPEPSVPKWSSDPSREFQGQCLSS